MGYIYIGTACNLDYEKKLGDLIYIILAQSFPRIIVDTLQEKREIMLNLKAGGKNNSVTICLSTFSIRRMEISQWDLHTRQVF